MTALQRIPPSPVHLPEAPWLEVFDQALPQFVKRSYLPNERLRNLPFNEKDLAFFSKGILELSERLTSDRPLKLTSSLKTYFGSPRYRSSYLLYWLPLQAAKFVTLLSDTASDLTLPVERPIRLLDLGAGPLTATWGFHMAFPEASLDVTAVDQNAAILKTGVAFAKEVRPEQIRITKTHSREFPAEPLIHALEKSPSFDWILLGNVLNEDSEHMLQAWSHGIQRILKAHPQAELLWVEPAPKRAAQRLSRLRDALLPSLPSSRVIRGPCLHTKQCPLSRGRDYCNQSRAIHLPGKTMRGLEKVLGSPRDHLKFSYFHLSGENPHRKGLSRTAGPHSARVVSNALKTRAGLKVQTCEKSGELTLKTVKSKNDYHRGDLILERPT